MSEGDPDIWSHLAAPIDLLENELAVNVVPESKPSTSQTVAENVTGYENETNVLHVQSVEYPVYGPDYYPIYRQTRGYCLILNIYEFPSHDDFRHGSQAETQQLKALFKDLYFDVQVVNNPDYVKIDELLNDYRKRDELVGHDCFILFVLSHGHKGLFYAADWSPYPFEDVVEKFTNKNCKNLINKPKLFYFSCCRGSEMDKGVEGVKSDTSRFIEVESVPVKVAEVNDIMICYACLDERPAFRNTLDGTWLGTELFKAFSQHSHEYHLAELMIDVSDRVNKRLSTDWQFFQEVEVIYRGFKKRLHFNPRYSAHSPPKSDINYTFLFQLLFFLLINFLVNQIISYFY